MAGSPTATTNWTLTVRRLFRGLSSVDTDLLDTLLGTWQSMVLVDLNRGNPRRSVRLSFVGG